MGQRFCLFTIGLLFCIFTKPVEAQLQPIFPAEGSTVTFAQLVSQGFSWHGVQEATQYRVEVVYYGFQNIPLGPYFTSTTFITLEDSQQRFYEPGNYAWQVTITAVAEGVDPSLIGVASNLINFQIPEGSCIIPTPTPFPAEPVEATPVPSEVGLPQNLRVLPSDIIPAGQVGELRFEWDPPATPEDAPFTYDLNIILPGSVNRFEECGIIGTSYQPEVTLTVTGTYTVLLRAQVDGMGVGPIVQKTFQVQFGGELPTPTPTPLPTSPDLSGDDVINAIDVYIFSSAFGSRRNQDFSYLSKADYNGDGIVNHQDMVFFISKYQARSLRWRFRNGIMRRFRFFFFRI